jgi:DNA-binding NarL/FixJ family response regulator
MEPGFRIVAEANHGEEALNRLLEHKPKVAVLDIDMPRMDGFEVVREVRRRNLTLAVVFLTMHKEQELFGEAMELGADAYVLKDSAAEEIVRSIRAAVAGRPFISPSLSGYLLNRAGRTGHRSIANLTSNEKRILALVAQHKTNKEIADQLFISHRTVENHRANICQKLGLHGTHALLKFAENNQGYLSENHPSSE